LRFPLRSLLPLCFLSASSLGELPWGRGRRYQKSLTLVGFARHHGEPGGAIHAAQALAQHRDHRRHVNALRRDLIGQRRQLGTGDADGGNRQSIRLNPTLQECPIERTERPVSAHQSFHSEAYQRASQPHARHSRFERFPINVVRRVIR